MYGKTEKLIKYSWLHQRIDTRKSAAPTLERQAEEYGGDR